MTSRPEEERGDESWPAGGSPGEMARGLIAGDADPSWWLAGATGGLLVAAVACWSFSRRDVR